jgi:O-antigen ligase
LFSVILLSLPTVFIFEIGYARDGRGFQGLLNHPQTLGVFLTPCACFLWGDFIFNGKKQRITSIILIFIIHYLLFITLARTALIALIISLFLVFLFSPLFRKNFTILFKKHYFLIVISIAIVFIYFYFNYSFSSFFEEYVLKGSGTNEIGEAFEKSRGFLLIRAWDSFLENPILGIGFGVSFEDYFNPIYDKITGIPISAPVEKSLLPIVVLEELGILGFCLFIPFILSIVIPIFKSINKSYPLLVLGCLMINIGEAVFFSIAALGLYLWLLLGWAMSTLELNKNNLFIQYYK